MTETVEDIKLDETLKKQPTLPKKYKVVVLNDDATPITTMLLQWTGLLVY